MTLFVCLVLQMSTLFIHISLRNELIITFFIQEHRKKSTPKIKENFARKEDIKRISDYNHALSADEYQ